MSRPDTFFEKKYSGPFVVPSLTTYHTVESSLSYQKAISILEGKHSKNTCLGDLQTRGVYTPPLPPPLPLCGSHLHASAEIFATKAN